jgi:hypothetical protein
MVANVAALGAVVVNVREWTVTAFRSHAMQSQQSSQLASSVSMCYYLSTTAPSCSIVV